MMQLQNWLSKLEMGTELMLFSFYVSYGDREILVTTDVEPTKDYEKEILAHIWRVENEPAT